MVIPLIAWIGASIIGGVLAGGAMAKGDGGGDKASWGGSIKKSQDAYQSTTTLTSSETWNWQPVTTFSPNYSYNPMTSIGHDITTSKKEYYSSELNPNWNTETQTNPSVTPELAQSMSSGGGGDIMDSVKQYLVFGIIGFVAYKMLVKKK
jgi:hypothetical protein